jgi:hypothetical protein
LDKTVLKHFFLRASQTLSGSLGGFWSETTVGLVIRCRPNTKGDDWEAIWIIDDSGSYDDLTYLQVFAKILLQCSHISPEYSEGRYHFSKGRFVAGKSFEGIVDEYYSKFHQMFTLCVPAWMRELKLKAAKEKKLEDALLEEERLKQALEIADAYASKKATELEQLNALITSNRLENDRKVVELEVARNACCVKRDAVTELELSLREMDIRLTSAEKHLKEIVEVETEVSKRLKQTLEDENALKNIVQDLEAQQVKEPNVLSSNVAEHERQEVSPGLMHIRRTEASKVESPGCRLRVTHRPWFK